MNEPDDILLCDKVKGNWTDEKIATEIPAWVQKGYFQISDIKESFQVGFQFLKN